MNTLEDKLGLIWQTLYGNQKQELLNSFILEIEDVKEKIKVSDDGDWYKDAVVYSIYVDLFNKDFNGLKNKLDYLQELGVSCLWLLPILDSPMRDAGFDIRDYKKIRVDLLGLPDESSDKERTKVFGEFLDEAHSRGIKVIFDIAINHTSDQHPWFQESRKDSENPYRDYYIWNKDKNLYKETRLIFEGMCPSNWEQDGNWFYFHRFFEFQPDLNFKNPQVLIEMTRNFIHWLRQGVDGFRADAIPYLWKEDGTSCENLPKTHTVVSFFRAVIDYLKPGTLLLAEACQPPKEVVKYIGTGDECNAGYHFPLMPQMFKAIEMQSTEPILKALSTDVTPEIPDSSQWFTFLRCHDELSLELVYVSEEDRKFIHEHYCHQPEWDFRLGQGISARMAELFKKDPRKIALAYSVMLSLPGTPVIYYGDEFGKTNDHGFYEEQIKLTGKNDTRFLVRGKVDWPQVEEDLKNKDSFAFQVNSRIKNLINTRNQHPAFGRGKIEWVELKDDFGNPISEILSFFRIFGNDKILVLNNLSDNSIEVNLPFELNSEKDLLGNTVGSKKFILEPFNYYWISFSS